VTKMRRKTTFTFRAATMKRTFKAAHAMRKKALFQKCQSNCSNEDLWTREDLTNTGQKLRLSETFCEVPGSGIRGCRAVEGVQSCCDGGEDCT